MDKEKPQSSATPPLREGSRPVLWTSRGHAPRPPLLRLLARQSDVSNRRKEPTPAKSLSEHLGKGEEFSSEPPHHTGPCITQRLCPGHHSVVFAGWWHELPQLCQHRQDGAPLWFAALMLPGTLFASSRLCPALAADADLALPTPRCIVLEGPTHPLHDQVFTPPGLQLLLGTIGTQSC